MVFKLRRVRRWGTGEPRKLHLFDGFQGRAEVSLWSWGVGEQERSLTGDATAQAVAPAHEGSMPECVGGQGYPTGGRHSPFGKIVL